MARIEFTIETSWSHYGYSGEIEIDDEDLEGLTPEEREKHISDVVGAEVENQVSWGWEEVADE
jgi:hypothetical protein